MLVDPAPSVRRAEGPRAPRLVIDGRGREVGVLVGHAEYVALLAHLSALAAREAGEGLPAYWRRALRAWIPEGGT